MVTIVGLAVGIVLLMAVWSSTEVVDSTEARALVVLGEYHRTLEPGLDVVPPFVSRTYSIDRRPHDLTVSTGDARSRDGAPVAVEASVEARVAEPESAFRTDGDPFGTTRKRATDAVYDAVRSQELADVLDYPGDVGDAVQRELLDAEDWGVEVRRVTVENVEREDGVETVSER